MFSYHHLFIYVIFFPLVFSIDRRNQQVVAIKLIDLEEAEDEIEDIQQEMSVLAEVCKVGFCIYKFMEFLFYQYDNL